MERVVLHNVSLHSSSLLRTGFYNGALLCIGRELSAARQHEREKHGMETIISLPKYVLGHSLKPIASNQSHLVPINTDQAMLIDCKSIQTLFKTLKPA